jgi:hypothetical protein
MPIALRKDSVKIVQRMSHSNKLRLILDSVNGLICCTTTIESNYLLTRVRDSKYEYTTQPAIYASDFQTGTLLGEKT